MIILSQSKTGLQNCLNTIFLLQLVDAKYKFLPPKKNKNKNQNKIVLFQKRARKCTEFWFYIDNQIIDVVQEYSVYALRNSKFFIGKFYSNTWEKALHALFGLKRYTDFSKLKPYLALKILMQWSPRFWLTIVKSGVCLLSLNLRLGITHKLKKTHLQFCKRYLDILYLQSKNEDSIVKQSPFFFLSLHTSGKYSFHSRLMEMSEYFNPSHQDPDLLDTAKIRHFVSLMKQIYISYWQQTLHHSQKLRFYIIFKIEYAPPCYII